MIIGNGMVGLCYIEKLNDKGGTEDVNIIVFCEEPRVHNRKEDVNYTKSDGWSITSTGRDGRNNGKPCTNYCGRGCHTE